MYIILSDLKQFSNILVFSAALLVVIYIKYVYFAEDVPEIVIGTKRPIEIKMSLRIVSLALIFIISLLSSQSVNIIYFLRRNI